jgi:hypothetical protein
MLTLPMFETQQLVLRRFELDEAAYVQYWLNDPEMADTLMDVTLPYTLDDARNMITFSHAAVISGEAYLSLRQDALKNGVFEDVEFYGLVKGASAQA